MGSPALKVDSLPTELSGRPRVAYIYIYIHTTMYTSGLSFSPKKEILPFLAWMDLEDIMLNEISQIQKDKYVRFHLNQVLRILQ